MIPNRRLLYRKVLLKTTFKLNMITLEQTHRKKKPHTLMWSMYIRRKRKLRNTWLSRL